MEPVVCLHGFGVRGSFWELFAREATPRFQVETPSFDHADLGSAVKAVETYLTALVGKTGRPVHVVGHSLGGVVGALAVQNLDSRVAASLTLVSSPWGAVPGVPSFHRWELFLLNLGWLPGFVVRPRFFGPKIPPRSQKELFQKAVPEAAGLRKALGERPWFSEDHFGGCFPVPVQGIGSEADRIVGIEDTRNFAEALGGRFFTIPKSEGWGHDDPAVEPARARQLVEALEAFVRPGPGLGPGLPEGR